jgi:Ribbon-helix-helix protein, copG family
MRTPLTLDDDVAAALDRLCKTRKASLKDLVNEALRRGLKEIMRARPKRCEPFRTQAVALGRLRIGNLDNVAEVLAIAEGDSLK